MKQDVCYTQNAVTYNNIWALSTRKTNQIQFQFSASDYTNVKWHSRPH